MKQITRNVYVEGNMLACNLGLITTKDGIVLVDSPLKPTDAMKWKVEALKKGTIRYVINTEEHADHWLGTGFLPGTVITSQETRDKLSKGTMEKAMSLVKASDPDGLPLMKNYRTRLADITFADQMSFYLGEHTFKLFSLQGHSTGGIGVYIPEEKVVFATDIVFCRLMSWLREATPAKWLESLKKLGELDVDYIVGGHGEVCNKDYLKEEAGVVQAWVDLVQSAIKKGWSKEEALARIASSDPYPKLAGTPGTAADLNRDTINHLYAL